jgi:hypothetical protein
VRVILLGVNAEHEATRQRRIATFWIDEAAIVAKCRLCRMPVAAFCYDVGLQSYQPKPHLTITF